MFSSATALIPAAAVSGVLSAGAIFAQAAGIGDQVGLPTWIDTGGLATTLGLSTLLFRAMMNGSVIAKDSVEVIAKAAAVAAVEELRRTAR